MDRFTRAIASALDSTARTVQTAGDNTGASGVADAINNTVIGPIRAAISNEPCTCDQPNCTER